METYGERMSKILSSLEKAISLPRPNKKKDIYDEEKTRKENTIIDTEQYVNSVFGGDIRIKYEIIVTGRDDNTMLVDVKPKNLYTACRFLGLALDVEHCPEEGKIEFERFSILYDHIEGMSILPNDPLDDLDDIIPIF